MSTDSLFSAHWHRVRHVCPRLASDVTVTRHVYRGRISWVLQRRTTNACHRLDTASLELVDRLDGRLEVGEVWEQALLERDADAPTQDQWIALLAQLQAAELLVVDQRVPTERLFERRETRRSRERRERRLNPLYLRFALYDPDAVLTRLAPLARVLFSRPTLWLWLALVSAGAAALFADGAGLAELLSDPAFPSPRTALLLALVYPPLKFLHELAHALAVKRCGGEVHETGIALMVLMPLPYVDASASAAFAEKRDRMLVSVAGMMVELAFAAVGALLWSGTGGVLQEIGLALLLVGGLSTLLVNGNPLLRFDGYYVLADALEIPNLASRSRLAVLARLRAWLSGEPHGGHSSEDRRERLWLLGYGVLSGLYRTGLLLWIAWWLSGRFLLFGLALAAFALVSSLLMPLWRGLRSIGRDPALRTARPLTLLLGGSVLLATLALWLPLPHANTTLGVVWLPDEAILRAPGACEIVAASVRPGTSVRTGETLFECIDPELGLRERELLARADELDVRLAGSAINDPSLHTRLVVERQANEAALRDVRERIAAGRNVAALDGRFDTFGTSELEGRALARGDIAGYVVPPRRRTVRVALDENVVGQIDAALERIEIRVSEPSGAQRVHRSSILARTPRPSRELSSVALGTAGGGEHTSDPSSDGRRVLEPVFDLELAWPETVSVAPVGSHVGVRFVHAPAPLGGRIAAALHRALARRSRA